ncbi:MAG: hypothetical protein M1825_002613 [Sarcosagium campestre]|nr:MAG: hypothetical protein M1825_002613 [Sarcosagium campestre]
MTCWSSLYFLDIVRAALRACNQPPQLVQSVVCWPSVAPHLTSHPGISHITFIGSRRVAHAVASSAAESLTPVCVELGGKDAAVLLDDVNKLDKVASVLLRGCFQSGGQNCIGIERIIACKGIYTKLVNILQPRVQALRLGSALDEDEGVDVGAMISSASFDRLEVLIRDAVRSGARCLVGGSRFNHPQYPKGHYFAPTLLVDVTPEMSIAREEVFAPICLVMKAINVDDAIRIANSVDYGLGASVFGTSAKDLDRFVAASKTGMVSVNDFAVYYAVQLPFGGVRGSGMCLNRSPMLKYESDNSEGYGRFAGEEGLRSLSNTKAVCRDRFPKFIATAIPKPLDYPIPNTAKAWQMCIGIVEVGYGETIKRKLHGLWRLVRNA